MPNYDSCGCSSHSGGLSRRGFLRMSLGSALGFGLGGGLLGSAGQLFAQEAPAVAAAEHCIFLFLNGAPSQLETFDPKPGHANGGPTRAIDTAAPGIQIAHTLPRLADEMQDVSLIRSMATGEGNHQRARYYLHTGYVPSGTVAHPDIGSLICQQKAEEDFDLPSYIAIGGATPGPGILGVAHSPLNIANPERPVDNLAYAEGVNQERFGKRRALLAALGSSFEGDHPGPEVDGHSAVYRKADRMMHSPRAAAFDLTQEPDAMRDAYGRNRFGQGCLMARRLIEQGVKVVEVQLGGWDTHQDNFNRTTALNEQLDGGFATLLSDLRQREMLEKTLIVCMGEFGRTPRINANEGRDHFARAWSMALAGGPIRGGQVVGATSADGMEVVDSPVSAKDLMATIAQATGLDPEHTNYTRTGRPLTAVDAGGSAIESLLRV
ncbi:DUF1501 domain-containing protein [Planctomycetota bacterium]|nr:DUF1501 domain-containing protein [Planctomycetota bacterium]